MHALCLVTDPFVLEPALLCALHAQLPGFAKEWFQAGRLSGRSKSERIKLGPWYSQAFDAPIRASAPGIRTFPTVRIRHVLPLPSHPFECSPKSRTDHAGHTKRAHRTLSFVLDEAGRFHLLQALPYFALGNTAPLVELGDGPIDLLSNLPAVQFHPGFFSILRL